MQKTHKNVETRNCFVFIIDNIAWIVGWTEGLIVGLCVGCYEAEENLGLAENLQEGCTTGFSEGEWLGNIEDIPKKLVKNTKRRGKYVRFAK